MYKTSSTKPLQEGSFDDTISDNRLCQEIIDSMKVPSRTQKRSVLTKDHSKCLYYKPKDCDRSDSTVRRNDSAYIKGYCPHNHNPREIPELPPRGIRKMSNYYEKKPPKHVRYAQRDNIYDYPRDENDQSYEHSYEYSHSDVHTNTDYFDPEDEKYKAEYIQKYLKSVKFDNSNKQLCDSMSESYPIDKIPVKDLELHHKYTECNLPCEMTYVHPNIETFKSSTEYITETEVESELKKHIEMVSECCQTDPVVIESVKLKRNHWTQTEIVQRFTTDVRTSDSDFDNEYTPFTTTMFRSLYAGARVVKPIATYLFSNVWRIIDGITSIL